MALTRRAWIAATGAALAGCGREPPRWPVRWVGAAHAAGHRLREPAAAPVPAHTRRASVLVVGAGVAGLACARALVASGVDDVQVFDLEAEAGGNARGHAMGGIGCPLGAHYLPVPGPAAEAVAALLEDFGLRRVEHGRVVYDERHLCHSLQERLFIDGHWHEGLLPPPEALPAAQRAPTLAQYRAFERAVAEAGQGGRFAVPTARAAAWPGLGALDAQTFAQWLDARGLDAPALRWYLDYSCRDDFGAGLAQVSAWAGLHYFASRHGFRAPGGGDGEREGVLTWPEGNAWLTRRMAAPLGARLHTGRLVRRVVAERHGVSVDVEPLDGGAPERWTASQVVLAVPLFVARRLLAAPPAPLADAVAAMRWAPWLVANLALDGPLADRPGAPPAWDNVIYRGRWLGYVDAMHQSLRPDPGATVLTVYAALGGNSAGELAEGRRRLLEDDAAPWAARLVDELTPAHPDLPRRITAIDLARHGHAMSVPVPGVRSHPALAALARPQGRLHLAHADLAGYSVFEEALHHGERAARDVIAAGRR